MKTHEIQKLYATIYDVAFAGEMPMPPLVINPRPAEAMAMHWCWTLEEKPYHAIEYFSLMHWLAADDEPLEIVDTLTHELVHGLQFFRQGGGRYGTHGKQFQQELDDRLAIVREFFNA